MPLHPRIGPTSVDATRLTDSMRLVEQFHNNLNKYIPPNFIMDKSSREETAIPFISEILRWWDPTFSSPMMMMRVDDPHGPCGCASIISRPLQSWHIPDPKYLDLSGSLLLSSLVLFKFEVNKRDSFHLQKGRSRYVSSSPCDFFFWCQRHGPAFTQFTRFCQQWLKRQTLSCPLAGLGSWWCW